MASLFDDAFRPWRHELILRWDERNRPLPLRQVSVAPSRRVIPPTGQPWYATGPVHEPFDFTSHMRRLMNDVVVRCPEFGHVLPDKVLLAVTQARSGHAHGLQARVTPLRFLHGDLVRLRRGIPYQVQRFFLGDHEFLYHMTFCLPRFLDQSFDDKLVTLFHELHHIGPEFNGDLRRHAGRCRWHTSSKRGYDKHMAELARAYLAAGPDPSLLGFLRFTFAELQQRHGSVIGVMVPRPKLIPISITQAAAARDR